MRDRPGAGIRTKNRVPRRLPRNAKQVPPCPPIRASVSPGGFAPLCYGDAEQVLLRGSAIRIETPWVPPQLQQRFLYYVFRRSVRSQIAADEPQQGDAALLKIAENALQSPSASFRRSWFIQTSLSAIRGRSPKCSTLARMKSLGLGSIATDLHIAPAARVVLAAIEKQPAAGLRAAFPNVPQVRRGQ